MTKDIKQADKQNFTLTVTLENCFGYEVEKTFKIKGAFVGSAPITLIWDYLNTKMRTIKNKKPHVMSRSRGSDY